MDTVSGFTSVTKEGEDIRVKAKINLQQFHAFFFSPSAFFNGLLHYNIHTRPPPPVDETMEFFRGML